MLIAVINFWHCSLFHIVLDVKDIVVLSITSKTIALLSVFVFAIAYLFTILSIMTRYDILCLASCRRGRDGRGGRG